MGAVHFTTILCEHYTVHKVRGRPYFQKCLSQCQSHLLSLSFKTFLHVLFTKKYGSMSSGHHFSLKDCVILHDKGQGENKATYCAKYLNYRLF